MTLVCDACGDKMPNPTNGGWVFFTPPGPRFTVADPRWAVCAGCAPLVVANDLVGLLERWDSREGRKSALTITEDNKLVPDPTFDRVAMRQHVVQILSSLVAHQDGNQRRITEGDL